MASSYFSDSTQGKTSQRVGDIVNYIYSLACDQVQDIRTQYQLVSLIQQKLNFSSINIQLKPKESTMQEQRLGKRICTNDESFEVILFESEKIGEGQFGACYLGYYALDSAIVLIKKVNRKPEKSSSKFQSEYKKEVVNLSKAGSKYKQSEHSNIVNVYPFFLLSKSEHKNITHGYIIMQFCENGSLSEYMNQRRSKGKWLNFGEFYKIFTEILDGYGQLYGENLLHQDLKPDNIFINKGIIKIGDFGLSYSLDSEKLTPSGTRDYNAIEKYEGAPPSFLSDLYSLGVIFYELIYGKHPYFTQQQFDSYYSKHPDNPDKRQIDFLRIVKEKQQKLNQKAIRQKIFYEFLKSRPSINKSTNRSYKITVKNNDEKQCLMAIIKIVENMISFDYRERPTFQVIRCQVDTFKYNVHKEELRYLMTKKIPKKLKSPIQHESQIHHAQIPIEIYHNIQRDLSQFPALSNFRQQCEITNLISGLLFSLSTQIQSEIKKYSIYSQFLQEVPLVIKKFNYCVTFYRYKQLAESIIEFDEQQLKIFYSSGIDYLLNNTRSNKKFLENQVPSSFNLRSHDLEISYKEMDLYLRNSLIFDSAVHSKLQQEKKSKKGKGGELLDGQNCYCFKILTIIMDIVKLGKEIRKEDLYSLQQKQRTFLRQRQSTTVFNVAEILENNYQISFPIIQINDD